MDRACVESEHINSYMYFKIWLKQTRAHKTSDWFYATEIAVYILLFS